jgi:hypothetical protein
MSSPIKVDKHQRRPATSKANRRQGCATAMTWRKPSMEKQGDSEAASDLYHVWNVHDEAPLGFGKRFMVNDLMFENVETCVGSVVVSLDSVGNALTERLQIAVAIKDRKRDAMLLGKVMERFVLKTSRR